MSRASRAIWNDVLQFALSWGLLAGFIIVVSFLAAEPISELDLGSKSLPGDWEAAYLNHGRYLRGYLIENHPLAFTTTLVLLIGSFVGLWYVRRLTSRESEHGRNARTSLQKLVNIILLLVTIVVGVVLYRVVLSGRLPA